MARFHLYDLQELLTGKDILLSYLLYILTFLRSYIIQLLHVNIFINLQKDVLLYHWLRVLYNSELS